MKKVLIILLILIVLFVGLREPFSNRGSRSIRDRSIRRFNNKYNRNRKNFFNNYRNRYLNYYPMLYPSLRTNCKWIKVCDDDWYYH